MSLIYFTSNEEKAWCKSCAHRLLKRIPEGRRFRTFTYCTNEENDTNRCCLGSLYEKTEEPAKYHTNLGILTNEEIKKQRVIEKEELEIRRAERFTQDVLRSMNWIIEHLDVCPEDQIDILSKNLWRVNYRAFNYAIEKLVENKFVIKATITNCPHICRGFVYARICRAYIRADLFNQLVEECEIEVRGETLHWVEYTDYGVPDFKKISLQQWKEIVDSRIY